VRDEVRRKGRAESAARPRADPQDELFAALWRLAVTATKSAKKSELLRGATVGQIALTPSDRSVMEELVVEAVSIYESRRTRARAPRSALHKAIPLLEREANRDDVLVAPLRERLRDLIDELRKLAAAASPPAPLAKRSKTDENFDELVDRLASCWEWVTRTRFRQVNLPEKFVRAVVKFVDPARLRSVKKAMEKTVKERRKFPRTYRR
jgi:hypothetical protein